MVQGKTPERIKYLMDRCREDGADALGVQFEQLSPEYRTDEIARDILEYAGELPVYFTNYRRFENEGRADETLAEELLKYAEMGGTLCDIMGDIYCPTEGELTMDETAIEKQMKLIDELHKRGAEVLMSSHVLKYTPAERVLEIALEHQRRGADICKIVTSSDDMEQQMENLRIIALLKQKLSIPFLFLTGGECRIIRRIGGKVGCCIYLCVHEYDDVATPLQPLICDVQKLNELL
jgi:3-dehydroquinate dehydratase type I